MYVSMVVVGAGAFDLVYRIGRHCHCRGLVVCWVIPQERLVCKSNQSTDTSIPRQMPPMTVTIVYTVLSSAASESAVADLVTTDRTNRRFTTVVTTGRRRNKEDGLFIV